jgi:uncharacterized oxidoreductase
MLSFYVDPRALGPVEGFLEQVRRFVDWIRAAAPIDPEAGVLIPGDKERATAAERAAHGIPLPAETWGAILGAAHRTGLSQAEIDRLLAD